jgi:hypothetical protein
VNSRARRNRQPRSAALGALLLLLGAATLGGCAPQVTVRSAWQEGVARDLSFTRMLVVGVSPDINQRCAFERFLAAEIQSPAVQAITSCDAMTTKIPLTVENVERAIAAQGVDSVLATRLVGSQVAAAEGGTGDTRGGGRYKATDLGYWDSYYGLYGVPVVYGEFQTTPSIFTFSGEVEIASKLYSTRESKLVYELTTKARDLQSRNAAMAEITIPIAERLRRDGLVR